VTVLIIYNIIIMLSFLGLTESDIKDICHTNDKYPETGFINSKIAIQETEEHCIDEDSISSREDEQQILKELDIIMKQKPTLSTMTICGNFGGLIDLDALMDKSEIMPYWILKEGIIRIECFDKDKVWKYKGISRKYLIRKNPGTGPFPNGVTAFVRIFDEETGEAREPSIKIFRNGGFQITGIRTPLQSDFIVSFMTDYLHSLGDGVFTKHTTGMTAFTAVSMMNTDLKIGRVINRKAVQEILHAEKLKSTYETTSYQGVNIKYYWNPGRHARGEKQTGICPCSIQCSSSGKKRVVRKPGEAVEETCTRITVAPFQKGKIVITAAKNEQQLHDAIEWIIEFLKKNHAKVIGRIIDEKTVKSINNPFRRSQRNLITLPASHCISI